MRRICVNFKFKLTTRIAWGSYPVDSGKYPMQIPIKVISQVRITRLEMIYAVREIGAIRQKLTVMMVPVYVLNGPFR